MMHQTIDTGCPMIGEPDKWILDPYPGETGYSSRMRLFSMLGATLLFWVPIALLAIHLLT